MKAIWQLDIREELIEREGEAIATLARKVARKGAIFIEVGSWKGYSTSFLGEVAKEYQGDVFCVDHWKGSPDLKHHMNIENCLEIFRYNMEELGLDKYVHPMVMESVMAAKIFADGIADLIFIDADHRYKGIKRDLEIWWPKVKVGGILCGHDFEVFYSRCKDPHLIDAFLGEEFVRGMGVHPGIMKALYEFFDDTHVRVPNTRVWLKEKT